MHQHQNVLQNPSYHPPPLCQVPFQTQSSVSGFPARMQQVQAQAYRTPALNQEELSSGHSTPSRPLTQLSNLQVSSVSQSPSLSHQLPSRNLRSHQQPPQK